MAFRLVSPNSLQPPVLECLRPDSQQVGTQPHLSAEQLPKVVLSAQPPLNIPHDTALPTSGQAPVSPSRKSAQTNLTYQGTDPRSKRDHTHLQPEKQRPQTRKVRQDGTAEKYVPDKGTR